ncbi:MAG: hypothetical protein JXR83_09485 [Deltaproteobacteria bacterium]|nr:hypothetical protein [Deltaproteobacteria bacterium]
MYLWTLMSDARSYVARADSQNATMAFWLASEVLDAVAALKSSERIALRPPERP